MSHPLTRFVVCPECDGAGVYVIARRGGFGHFPDGSEDNEELPCEECGGTGKVKRDDADFSFYTEDCA